MEGVFRLILEHSFNSQRSNEPLQDLCVELTEQTDDTAGVGEHSTFTHDVFGHLNLLVHGESSSLVFALSMLDLVKSVFNNLIIAFVVLGLHCRANTIFNNVATLRQRVKDHVAGKSNFSLLEN